MDELLDRFDKYIPNSKRCYTGRLDPLASGLIIILTNDDIYKKKLFCDMVKEYTFILLHGFKTDTYDIMGLVTDLNTQYNQEIINNSLPFDTIMEYPIYSNFNIKGKPSWYYANNNIQRPYIPTKQIKVFNLQQIGTSEITGDNLIKIINNKINKVSKKTFRQSIIINKWNSVIDTNNVYYTTKFTITLSSGGFVRYFADKMNGVCYDIHRTQYYF